MTVHVHVGCVGIYQKKADPSQKRFVRLGNGSIKLSCWSEDDVQMLV